MLVAYVRGDSIEGIAAYNFITPKTARTYIASMANRCRIARRERANGNGARYAPLVAVAEGEYR